MKRWLSFYAEHKLAWILPIVILVALIVILALTENEVPAEPFDYRGD